VHVARRRRVGLLRAHRVLPVASTGLSCVVRIGSAIPSSSTGDVRVFIQLGAIPPVYWHYQRGAPRPRRAGCAERTPRRTSREGGCPVPAGGRPLLPRPPFGSRSTSSRAGGGHVARRRGNRHLVVEVRARAGRPWHHLEPSAGATRPPSALAAGDVASSPAFGARATSSAACSRDEHGRRRAFLLLPGPPDPTPPRASSAWRRPQDHQPRASFVARRSPSAQPLSTLSLIRAFLRYSIRTTSVRSRTTASRSTSCSCVWSWRSVTDRMRIASHDTGHPGRVTENHR